MKKVLVIYYTQTGQQKDILDRVLTPLHLDPEVSVSYHAIKPKQDFEFPWNKTTFFDAFPESFLQIPCELEPVESHILDQEYDLIIMGYQVWYLSPSIPTNSFLMSTEGKSLLRGKPVVTVINCRNMWVMAQEKVKKQLSHIGARHVGNIALVDRSLNHVSVLTIVHWMMTGKKERYLGILPKPGVSDKDVREAVKFGNPLLTHLKSGNFDNLQNNLLALGAVSIRSLLVFVDKRGSTIFSKWAPLIRKRGLPGDPKRKPLLRLFYYYLATAIWVIAPIVSALYMILHLPFLPFINKQKKYYQSVQTK